MNKFISHIIMIPALAIVALGCGKNIDSNTEADNWKDWMGVKVMMEDAGFETKGIKVLMGSPSDVCLYLPETKGYAHSWIGEKNGKPWIGIAYCDPEDSTNDFFIKDFVLTDHRVPKSITKEKGYGHTVTVDFQYVTVFYLVMDEQYTYIGVKDVYGDSDNYFEENPVIYIHDGNSFCASISDIDLSSKLFGNVGYDHDLLAFNACYSKDGRKLYDMANEKVSSLAAMDRGGWYLTYPLSHEVLVTVGYYQSFPCVEAVIVNLKTGESPLVKRLRTGEGRTEKPTSFKLDSKNGNVFIYKLETVNDEGKARNYTIRVDVESNTASIE